MKLKNKYIVGDNHDAKTFKDITIEEITNELNQYITKIN